MVSAPILYLHDGPSPLLQADPQLILGTVGLLDSLLLVNLPLLNVVRTVRVGVQGWFQQVVVHWAYTMDVDYDGAGKPRVWWRSSRGC